MYIEDDGDAGTFSFVGSSYEVSEASVRDLTLTVTRNGGSSKAISVDVVSVDNTDILEIQTIYCKADSGTINVEFNGKV